MPNLSRFLECGTRCSLWPGLASLSAIFKPWQWTQAMSPGAIHTDLPPHPAVACGEETGREHLSAGAESPAPPPPTMAISLGFHLGLPESHFNNLYGCYHKPTSGVMGSVREKEPRPECQVGWAASPDWGGGGLGLQALACQSLVLWLTYKSGEGFLPWHPGPGTVAAGFCTLRCSPSSAQGWHRELPGLFLPPSLLIFLPSFLPFSFFLLFFILSFLPPFFPFFYPPFPSQFGACVPHSRSSREANGPCPHKV